MEWRHDFVSNPNANRLGVEWPPGTTTRRCGELHDSAYTAIDSVITSLVRDQSADRRTQPAGRHQSKDTLRRTNRPSCSRPVHQSFAAAATSRGIAAVRNAQNQSQSL